METIIYTNSKREAANYEVDKVYLSLYQSCFTDRVDVGQLIEDEMNHYNIRHLNLWFINDNVNNIEGSSQEKILTSTAKYFLENKDMTFIFEYLVEKYLPLTLNEKKNLEGQCSSKISNISTIREESLSTISDKMRESQQSCKSSTVKTSFIKEQIVRRQLKFNNFQDFQVFIYKDPHNHLYNDMIKTFVFKSNTQILKISFIEQNRRDFLRKIIDYDYDRVYDAKLNLKKKFTFHLDDFSFKHQQMMSTVAAFHNKLILFLIQNQKNDNTKKKTMYSKFKPNLSLKALEQWKLKEDNVDIVSKLQRECELIKQQIQRERLLFRNKIRTIENYIGETINVEKLLQQQQSDETNKFQPSQTTFNHSFKKNELHKRSSALQVQGNQTFNNVAKFIMNSLQNTSQFKRLKDISDAMRSIDNTLLQQNRKIEMGNKKLKQLIKNRQALIYTNACQLNKIKDTILSERAQIKRKEMEIDQKRNNGTFDHIAQLKNKQPSSQAKITLQKHKIFINQQKHHQNIDSSVSLSQFPNSEKPSKKDEHKYRIVNKHQSEHSSQKEKQNEERTHSLLKYRDKLVKKVQNSYLKQDKLTNQKKSLLKKAIRKPFSLENTIQKEQILQVEEPSEQEIRNGGLFESLLNLYDYYLNNENIFKKVKKEVETYKIVEQQPLNTICKSLKGVKKNTSFSLEELQREKLILTQFPILKEHLADKQCSKSLQSEKNRTVQISRELKEEIRFSSHYFDLMTNPLSNNHMGSVCKVHHKTVSSLGSEQMDNVVESKVTSQYKPPSTNQASSKVYSSDIGFRQKRITIEQAIRLNSSQLKLSRIK